MAKERYPLEMHHPHYRKGRVTSVVATKLDGRELRDKDGNIQEAFKSVSAEPDLFPPVIVKNADQEAFHRAKGYLAPGEAEPAPVAYAEYPVMLSHPGHEDGAPERVDMFRDGNGQPQTVVIPGKPEKFPPKQANTKAEEEALVAKGYRRLGTADPAANQKAKAAPYDPNFKAAEYPKMSADGKTIVDPLNTMQHNKYPMYVGNVLVNNEAEEREARKSQPQLLPAERCIICGDQFKAGEEWTNGAAGPLHASHLTGAPTPNTTPKSTKPKSAKRVEAGKRAAETRAARKERERQAAQGS